MGTFEVGDIGHLLVIVSFITSLVGTGANFFYSNQLKDWKIFSRSILYIHAFSVIGIVASLFVIIHTHDYRYHYAWSHSSNDLPVHYMISCFWEGQEGSFLLWIFWNVVLSFFLIFSAKRWEGPVMTIFFLVQFFLTSMILGVVIGDVKIGSSPFILLKDVFPDAPVFQNPSYVPEDGQGLNPLLQNYWMVIHPPTLFLGFALTMIPFLYCIAGLWKKQLTEWINPALPWTIFSSAVLGLGIIMGGYWAYETLNFGGYWNWDPVENAVLVPWIVQIAALHLMVLYRRQKGLLSMNIFLVITVFILILYSTFLTRSGVLGEASVHSFTDLGLSGQLLIYLGVFILLSYGLMTVRMKSLPDESKLPGSKLLENLVLIGTSILLLSALQVLLGTSLPVINKIVTFFGGNLNKTPLNGEDYNNWQIWFASFIGWVAGFTQFSWWNNQEKMFSRRTVNIIFYSIISLIVISAGLIYYSENDSELIQRFQVDHRNDPEDYPIWSYVLKIISYILLLSASLFAIGTSLLVCKKLWKKNKSNLGGAIAHFGFSLMMIGILFSAGYSKVVSLNQSGFLFSREATKEFNAENILLRSGEPTFMNDYQLTYKGQRVEVDGFPGYISWQHIFPLMEEGLFVIREPISWKGKQYYDVGDTVKVRTENTYYEIEYVDRNSHVFTLYPRAQQNPNMGFIASPDVRRGLTKDLYTHVASVPDRELIEWSEKKEHELSIKDTFTINGMKGTLDSIRQVETIPGIRVKKDRVLATAYFTFETKTGTVPFNTSIVYHGLNPEASTDEINLDLGIRMYFKGITPEKLYFVSQTTNKDYIIMKAMKKPLINLLWVGTIILVIGFLISAGRRYREFRGLKSV